MNTLDRRAALQRVATLMGGTLSAPTLLAFLDSCQPKSSATAASTAAGKPGVITDNHRQMTAEIAEHIIPKTKTPGAKDAGVPAFIGMMLKDCYPAEVQQAFYSGLDALDAQAKDQHKTGFVASTPAQQVALLKAAEKAMMAQRDTDRAAAEKNKGNKDFKFAAPHFFGLAKELTLLGYFTSEAGATQALAYLPVPGKYEGCVTMTPGQKAWAL